MNKQLPSVLFLLALVLWAVPALAQVDTVWVRRYDGPAHGVDQANAIGVDASGNAFVTGETPVAGGGYEFCTIKYRPNGDTAWVRRFRGMGAGANGKAGRTVSIDKTMNAYVTGSCMGVQAHDFYTIKYLPNGDTAWVRRYGGPGWSEDYARSLDLDTQGNIYVTGSGDSSRFLTLKYNSQGQLLWGRHYPPAPGRSALPNLAEKVATNERGEVYVAGSGRRDTVTFSRDFLIVKYTADGDTVWSRLYDGPAHEEDQVGALAVDDSGYAYVTGASAGIGTGYDWCTIKYRPNGDVAWVQRYNGLGNYDDYPNAIALDNVGSVYVAGDVWDGAGSGVNFCTIKYDTGGAVRWVRKYDGPGHNSDGATDLALDRAGNVYLSGWTMPTNLGSEDYGTIKYNSAGTMQWVTSYDGPMHSFDYATAIALDTLGNIYVTGNSVGDTVGGPNWDYCTIKYRQTVGVEEKNLGRPVMGLKRQDIQFHLVTPIKKAMKASYFLPQSGVVRLEVFDVAGRNIKTLIQGWQEAGWHEVRSPLALSAGVYFVRLSAGGAALVRKGVVVK